MAKVNSRLLQRYMDPEQGAIRVNGYDLRDVRLHSWRSLVAYIPQRPQVFDGTLRDNLIYGLTTQQRGLLTDENIWHVMRRLRIDFGGRLTQGLETLVGRHGMKLSGGEAQRVMIGAAVLRQPRFMIIDEATSSLDAENQEAVQAGLYHLLQGEASAILIAHRLSTLMGCNKFVVLRNADQTINGRSQVETIATSTSELYRTSPTFRRLAELEGVQIPMNG